MGEFLTILLMLVLVLVVFVLPLSSASAALGDEGVIYFAGGCFWGVEHMMEQVPGVVSATSGYANGSLENPDYKAVLSGTTGHRETVRVVYDKSLVMLHELVELFFASIDPTLLNRQGADIGSQYQTGIYYTGDEDGFEIQALAEDEAKKHSAFHVEILPLTSFYEAEEYHQDYLVKNPTGYCHLGAADFERARNTGRQPQPRVPQYQQIKPKDAWDAMNAGREIIIVDVREPFEFAAGRIPGSINLPLGDLVALAGEHLPNKDALIFLYCRSGARSRSGAMMLVEAGYSNLYDLGGIINWPYDIEN